LPRVAPSGWGDSGGAAPLTLHLPTPLHLRRSSPVEVLSVAMRAEAGASPFFLGNSVLFSQPPHSLFSLVLACRLVAAAILFTGCSQIRRRWPQIQCLPGCWDLVFPDHSGGAVAVVAGVPGTTQSIF